MTTTVDIFYSLMTHENLKGCYSLTFLYSDDSCKYDRMLLVDIFIL